MDYASRTKRVQNFRWMGATRCGDEGFLLSRSIHGAAARSFSRQGTGGWTTRALPLSAERSNRAGAG